MRMECKHKGGSKRERTLIVSLPRCPDLALGEHVRLLDWIDGRYSMDSAIRPNNFRALLIGFHAMDQHFRTAPFETADSTGWKPRRLFLSVAMTARWIKYE